MSFYENIWLKYAFRGQAQAGYDEVWTKEETKITSEESLIKAQKRAQTATLWCLEFSRFPGRSTNAPVSLGDVNGPSQCRASETAVCHTWLGWYVPRQELWRRALHPMPTERRRRADYWVALFAGDGQHCGSEINKGKVFTCRCGCWGLLEWLDSKNVWFRSRKWVTLFINFLFNVWTSLWVVTWKKLIVAQISKWPRNINWVRPSHVGPGISWASILYWLERKTPFCLIIMIKSAKMVAILIKYSLVVNYLTEYAWFQISNINMRALTCD